MTLTFPGFSGHLPCQLQRIYPDMKLSPRPHWQGFNSSCLLDPSDTVHYKLISRKFLETQTEVYGSTHYYAFDQFNEMEPKADASLSYLQDISTSAYTALREYDAEAVWVMQAWFIVSIPLCHSGQASYCDSFWLKNSTQLGSDAADAKYGNVTYPRVAAYLGGVPKAGLLILDLEVSPF